jgi:NADPH:quinone reductase-like Zn-dependent oxidoreductase
MKAIRVQAYGGPEQLRLDDNVPDPLAGDGQVVVRVRATSVNPFDLKLASGAFRQMIPLTLPYAPGGDFAGIVDSIGAGVSGVRVGDGVYGNCPRGAYAEKVAAPAATVAPKPARLSFVDAASVPVAAQTAWQGLFDHGHLDKGQTVLIHAASGGVGTFAVQLAHWKGARVLATASGSNVEFVRSLGADVVIDYKTTPFESVAKDVDVVLDLIGGDTQARSYKVLKRGGYLVATAQPPSPDEAKQHGVQATMMQMQASTALLRQLASLLDAGILRTTVSKTFALAQAADAWQESRGGHTRGKIVLEVG